MCFESKEMFGYLGWVGGIRFPPGSNLLMPPTAGRAVIYRVYRVYAECMAGRLQSRLAAESFESSADNVARWAREHDQ